MFPIHPLPGAMAENLERERAFFLHVQKAELCISNLKCVFLDYCEEVEPRMSPTQRLEPEKNQWFLDVFIAQVMAPATPEVHQVDTPFYVVHISAVL